VVVHLIHFAFARAEFFDHCACVGIGTSMVRCSTGSMRTPSTVLVTSPAVRLKARNPLGAYLDKNCQLQLATAQHLEAVRRAGILHANADVGEQFLFKALAQISAG